MQFAVLVLGALLMACALPAAGPPPLPLEFVCAPGNDLYRAMGAVYRRHDHATTAVAKARPGSGILILADGYPHRTTPLDAALVSEAERKRVRIYVEFPSWLPGLALGDPRATAWERAVIASEAFGPSLRKNRILAIHDCRFQPVAAPRADIVMARVAGFDTAVYGLPARDVWPVLFEHASGRLLVATTKLSQFVTARYAPADAWGPIWQRVLGWLCPGLRIPALRWTPPVRPSYARPEPLPVDAELRAFRRGVRWYDSARLLIHPDWQKAMEDAGRYQDRVAPPPDPKWPQGDGSLGLLEGYYSTIRWDGTQPVRWWLRNDCMGESSMAFALSGTLDKNQAHRQAAAGLNDFIYFRSVLAKGPRSDPARASYGLVGWNTTARYHGNLDGYGVFYGDDNARSMLGTLAAAALLGTDRWDEPVLRCLLANLRTTGRLGFRRNRIDEGPLEKNGWRHYFDSEVTSYAPHYQAYLWAAFLWAGERTGYAPFLDRTKTAIRMTMAAYPGGWRWTNGIQQERARMLLPLAWLIRREDTREHRGWLRRVAADLLAAQDASGAIREEIGEAGKGDYGPPKSNEEYGKNEATLIQANGDPLCDLLYTTNFAFLGLHEAAAATRDPYYAEAENKLAGFLTRIQARSESHPELDGAWFRAFEFKRWDYWASNADAGWGAWSVETGWTQAWIASVLGLRHARTSLWDLTSRSRIARHLDGLLPLMFPKE